MATPEFQPQISKLQTTQFVNHYQKYPHLYDDERRDLIEVHASYYKLPFLKQHTSGIPGILQQAASGYMSGMTTFDVGDPPDSTYEGIARSVGHLAGFAGIVPLVPLKVLGVTRMAKSLGAAPAKYAMHGLSIPMLAAKAITKKAKILVNSASKTAMKGRADAVKTSANFLAKRRTGDIIEGAFTLGVASAVSTWRAGIDEMMTNFMHGATTGAAFRTIGNFVKMGNPQGDKMLRTLAASMYTGIPATLRGATTEEQVYEYLLGAYFGFKESPVEQRIIGGHIKKMFKEKTFDPEQVKGWEEFPADIQKKIKKKAEAITRKMDAGIFGNLLIKGIDTETYNKILEANVPEGFTVKGVDEKTGEPILELKPEVKKLEEKKRKEEVPPSDESPFETSQASEFTEPSTQQILQRSVNFVERKFRDRLSEVEAKEGLNEKILETKRLAENIDITIENYVAEELIKENHSDRINKSDKIIEELQTSMGVSFDLKDSGFIRRHVMNRLYGLPSVIISGEISGSNVTARKLPNNMTRLGNQRGNKEPIKAIELAYISAWERKGGVLPGGKKSLIKFEEDPSSGYKARTRRNASADATIAIAVDFNTFGERLTKTQVKGQGNQYIPINAKILKITPERVDKIVDMLNSVNAKTLNIAGNGIYTMKGKYTQAEVDTFTYNLLKAVINHPKLKNKIELVRTGGQTGFDEAGAKAGERLGIPTRVVAPKRWKFRPESGRDISDEKAFKDRFGEDIDAPTGEGYSLQKGGRPLAIHDHFVFKNDAGRTIEADFNDYYNHLKKKYDYNESAAIEEYITNTSRVMADMASKGYYYVGGRGDNQRNYFIKKHPDLNISKLSDLKKKLNIAYLVSDKKNKRKGFTDAYNAFRKNWKEDYGQAFGKNAGKVFDEMFMNNVLYEAEMNGLPLKADFSNVGVLVKKGFINNPIAFNKRMQIWLTNGIPGDARFMVERFGSDKIKFMIIPDAEGKNLTKDSKASEYVESTDGSIIVHDSYIDALAEMYGIAEGTAQNNVGNVKSFIVSKNPKLGAMLGKYMMHSAGESQSKQMEDSGVHMLVYESAAKQMGLRDFYKVYELDVSDIKGVTSELSDSHSIEPQRIPKQMFSNLTAFSVQLPDAKKNLNIMNKMMDEFIVESFNGNPVYNKKLKELRSNPSNENLREEVISNIEEVGVSELMGAIQDPNMSSFSARAYQKMIRVASESIDTAIAEGELDAMEGDARAQEIRDFRSKLERMARNSDPDKIGPYIHKYSSGMLDAIKRAYVVTKVTRPRVRNSISARMRPYDEELRQRFPELETDDTIFFLDNGFRDMKVSHEILDGWSRGDKTLGKVWDAYVATKEGKSKAFKGAESSVEEFLSAISMRVPMDSLSGAQKLSFKGFTGRKGFGILQHPRTMRAEGGADLDGDKSWVFFGWKPEYKELYDAHKKEFYKGDKIPDAKEDIIMRGEGSGKETYKSKFIRSSSYFEQEISRKLGVKSSDLYKQDILKFFPNARKEASEGASTGRNMLGPAVILKSTMQAAHSAIMATENKTQVIKGEKYEIIMVAKEDPRDWENFKRNSRAMIALSSDPMDEAGLASYNKFLLESAKSLFHIKANWITKKGKKPMDLESGAMLLRKGLLELAGNVNKAYWGKSRLTDKKYTSSEMSELVSPITELSNEQLNSYLFRVGKLLQPVDFSEGVFQRISEDKLLGLYNDYAKILRDTIDIPGFKALQDALGRTTVSVKSKGAALKLVFQNKLWSNAMRDIAAGTDVFDKIFKEGRYEKRIREKLNIKGEALKNWIRKRKEDPEYRKWIVDNFYKEMEHFIVNDITDMVTFNRVWDLFKKGSVTLPQIEHMSKKIEELKGKSYLAFIRNKEALKYKETEEGDPEARLLEKRFKKQAIREDIPEAVDIKEDISIGEPISSSMTQHQIDVDIMRYKSKLTEPQKDMFDALMLGSFTRKDNRTETSALGLSSTAIPDKSIKSFMKGFNDTFEKAENKQLYKEGKEEVDKISESTEGTAVEQPAEVLDELAPYRGLIDGKLKNKEDRMMLQRIKDNLNFFHNAVGKTIDIEARSPKKELNLFLRKIVGKDINAMNMEDWRVFDNYLEEMRRGPAISKIFKGIRSGGKIPKWWHWAFPRTVSRDMIKEDLVLLEENGIYFNDKGVAVTGPVLKPYTTLSALQKYISEANETAANDFIRLRNQFDEDFQFIDGINEGSGLWDMAIRTMERKMAKKIHEQYGNSDIGNYYKSVYTDAYTKSAKKHNWKELKGKVINIPGKEGERSQKTGQEIVDGIIEKITEKNENIFSKYIKGNRKYIERFARRDSKGNIIWRNKTSDDMFLDTSKFIKFVTESYRKGEPVPDDMGLDFLRKIAREMQIKQAEDLGHHKFSEMLNKKPIEATGQYEFDSYYPHLMMDKKASKENVKKSYEIIMNDKSLSDVDKTMHVKNLVMKYHNNTGEWTMEMTDNEHWETWDRALGLISENKKKEAIRTLDSRSKPGNLHSRTGQNPGWSTDPIAYHSYMKGVLDAYHRQIGQIVSRDATEKFYYNNHKKLGPKLTNAWQQFLNLYAQDSMGYPSVIPRSVLNNPKLNVKGTPYHWFADNVVVDKLNSYKKKLGLKSSDKIPEDLKNITISDIRTWTNLEAKFELMSLLAHPKTAIGNLYGGTTHTIASTGLENFKLGRNIGWLKTHLNPKWETKQDLWDFAEKHGVIEEFLIKEANFSPQAKNAKFQSFIKEATAKIKKDPELSDSSLMGIAKKHGVSDSIFNKAAWFMRTTERTLRRDAFMAHLVQAWRDFGMSLPYDHPFLIQKAKKGVQATQFLYSAPFRPAFSRTALGKVMTRFQLWAWNAVDFRKETYRQAAIRGYREGTPEFERLKRLMAMDMLMLGLGSVFTYSIFEAALPAPYNWLQDTAGLLFGDEKERDRAFFGAWPTPLAPLQLITPPIARLPVQSFTAAINGSWDKVASYTLPTMFPFGRMARDVYGTFKNPMFYAEKLTGFPVLQLQREVKKGKKQEFLVPRGIL